MPDDYNGNDSFEEHHHELISTHNIPPQSSIISGMSEKHTLLLDQLKSGDEVKIMQGVIDLSTELSVIQDSALSQSVLEQFIPPLLDCLNMSAFPEIVCTFSNSYSVFYHKLNQCN